MFDLKPVSTFHPLQQTSLNIQSILKDGSKELQYIDSSDERDEVYTKVLFDVIDEFPVGLTREELKMLTEIYGDNIIVKTFIGTLSEFIVNDFLFPTHNIPKVGVDRLQRMDNIKDFLDYVEGLKDGTVALTGTDSKLYLCNGNITNAKAVFYDNWYKLFKD